LSLSGVQDVIGIAIGGRAAGLVFEGDRRFQIIVRLPDAVRNDVDTLENLPVTLPQAAAGTGSLTIPLRQLATFNFSEGPNQISRENGKRRVVVTAEVRGRDIGSLVEETQGGRSQSRFPSRPATGWRGEGSSRTSRQRGSASWW
jgi:cobalt-zinc-cadmium resistance protein CzcA